MFRVETQTSAHFDALTTLQFGWDLSVVQLTPRTQDCSVCFYETTNVGLNWFRYGTAYDHKLHAREGVFSFGLFDPNSPLTQTYNGAIPNDALTVFPHDYDIQGSSLVGFCGSGIHLSEAFLTRLAEQAFGKPLFQLVPVAGIYSPPLEKIAVLRAELDKWRQLAICNSEIPTALITRREESLALAIIDALIGNKYVEQLCKGGSQSAVFRALNMIHDSDLENISAAELCIYTQCSQRTLEKGFRKQFGLTPKKYIKCLRLARVHNGLRNFDAQGYDSIVELAGIHGFWHMGQFAADYRRIYNVLPSDTMKGK